MPVSIPVGAELDERSATAAAEKARRVFADAGRDAGRAFGSGLGQADEGLRKFEKQAKDSYDRAADAAGKLRSEEEKLQSLRDRGARNDQIVSQAERVEKARRAEARAVRDATDAIRDYEDASSGAGQGFLSGLQGAISGAGTSGQDAANEFVGGFAGSSMLLRLGSAAGPIGLALAGVATIGVFAGRLLASGIADGLATIQLQDQFQAAMGLDEASMARYANAAGQAYANNFGTSVADNLAAARTALQSGLVAPGSSDADVQGVIEQVQGVSQVTGASAEELSRSVTQLMRTGFAGSASDALDIITAGFQDGLDVSHDWLDSINEYSTQFRKLGLGAGDWMTLLKQGLEGGARDTDKVADSLKEFSIRAVDGSKTTAEGFKALGFDADEMGRRFSEGGDSAKTAFGAVLEALRNTGDAQQQALIWQRLFGTQFEDMGDAINKLSLDPAKREFDDLHGTSDRATKTASDNFKSEWEEATRTVGQYFSDLKTDIADWFTNLPVVRDIPGLIKDTFTPTGGQLGYFDPNLKIDPNATGNMLIPPDLRVGAPPPAPPAGGGAAPAAAGPLGPFVQSFLGAPPPGTGSAPVPGDRTPIVPDDGNGTAKKTKPSFDPSQYSVDAIPVAGAPVGPIPAGGAPGVPMWGTGSDPFAKPGYGAYQVDPQKVYDAETSVMSARNSVESARIRVLEMEAEGTATAQDLLTAKNAVTMAERQYTSAQMKLAEAQQGAWKKMENSAKGFANGMGEIGAALDNDLGISKGLPGLAENLTKFIANIAAAPLLGQLDAISRANPSQGGYGLMGILGAQGVFGEKYNGIDYSKYGYGQSGIGPAALQPGYGGNVGSMLGLAQASSGNVKYGPASDLANGLADCSGSISDLVEMLQTGKTSPGRLFTTTNFSSDEEAAKLGFLPGYRDGALNVGVTPLPGSSGHMAATLPNGVNFEGGGGTGGGAQYGGSAVGALDPQFSKHYYMPVGGTATAPVAPAPTSTGPADIYNPANTDPGLTNPAAPTSGTYVPNPTPLPAFGGGGGAMAGGPPTAAPFTRTPGVGGIAPPAMPGGGGPGVGGGAMDMAMTAAGGLDLLAPGAGQAAQMGMKLANRAIQFGGQAAGIGVSGLMETFLPSGSPLGNLGNSWFGKLASGFASARPALPNTAAQKAPTNPNAQGQQGQSTNNTTNNNVSITNNGATEDGNGKDAVRHLEAMYSPTGVR
ncbi:hypothetical protein M2272_005849 [Mycobacterium frederiksbergense]|uniref:Phage tail tape measure protein domain-containing protein n=1 Tax=Mycolicibacterium frederiksbergense TaxID=117567 RepID=A0ABT6L895_9MYCO|nr:phage tail tape measure protein [Mycolicibacterium frederiksbergense]MDH6199181.1 hypothetical protein [Mycolicibacterium frederiksbergense]